MEASSVEQSATPALPEPEPTSDGSLATELCAPAPAPVMVAMAAGATLTGSGATLARSASPSTLLQLDAAKRKPSEAKSHGQSHAFLANQVKQLLERHREVAAQQAAMGEELERVHAAMRVSANEEGLRERVDNAPTGIDFRETARKLVGWATPPQAETHLSA